MLSLEEVVEVDADVTSLTKSCSAAVGVVTTGECLPGTSFDPWEAVRPDPATTSNQGTTIYQTRFIWAMYSVVWVG